MESLYQEQIIEAAVHPQHFEEMPDADLVVKGTNASCGDEVTIFIKFKDAKTKTIEKLSWVGTGCIISQASMSVLAAKLNHEHLSAKDFLLINQEEMEQLLGLENISIGRVKCLMLGLSTLHQHL